MIKIIEGNYDEFIKWNGLKEKNKPIAIDIKNNVAKYYIVLKNDEYYSEFILFPKEDNLINLNITISAKTFIEEAINYLKKDYDYLVFKSDENIYNNLDIIRNNYNCIEEYKEQLKSNSGKIYELTNIKISLK